MNYTLIKRIDGEAKRGLMKWGDVDRSPGLLLNAITEEVGEVAHAINHNEGFDVIQQEITEAMGVLSRLYDMVEGMQSKTSKINLREF